MTAVACLNVLCGSLIAMALSVGHFISFRFTPLSSSALSDPLFTYHLPIRTTQGSASFSERKEQHLIPNLVSRPHCILIMIFTHDGYRADKSIKKKVQSPQTTRDTEDALSAFIPFGCQILNAITDTISFRDETWLECIQSTLSSSVGIVTTIVLFQDVTIRISLEKAFLRYMMSKKEYSMTSIEDRELAKQFGTRGGINMMT
ncbi:hypothetical protein HDU76_001780 [Blyttiomyces sp. JEL0837]|nr:hypothetical protein HDU76_001780 [Blyttiomyces sp. JEL0837]